MMYLTTQARAMKPRYERLGTNTAAAYFAVFKKVLRMAYQERMIRDNLVDRLGVPAMAAGGCASAPKRPRPRRHCLSRTAQMYDSAPATCLDKGCGDKEAHHVPLLPPHLCHAPNRTRHGYLYGLQDAHPQEY